MVFGLGMWELLALLGIFLVIFGTKYIPNLAKGLGEGIRNFRREIRSDQRELGQGGDARNEGDAERSRRRDA